MGTHNVLTSHVACKKNGILRIWLDDESASAAVSHSRLRTRTLQASGLLGLLLLLEVEEDHCDHEAWVVPAHASISKSSDDSVRCRSCGMCRLHEKGPGHHQQWRKEPPAHCR